jgi:hypothetical protein
MSRRTHADKNAQSGIRSCGEENRSTAVLRNSEIQQGSARSGDFQRAASDLSAPYLSLSMKPTLDIILFAAAIVALALLADAWRTARHDSQQLAATLTAQNKQIQQAGSREDQRDSQLATALAAIQAQKRSVHTSQQAAAQLAAVLPQLPLPVSIQSPGLSPLLPPEPADPTATAISIPKLDVIPLYDALQDCRANSAENDSLQKDLSDEKSRSAALQRERDAAVATAKGGTFMVRLKRAAKWFAIGLTVGVVAAATAHR